MPDINVSDLYAGADHISITVTSIEKSLEFYQKAFGAAVIYQMGPFDAAEIPRQEDGRDWTEAHVNVSAAKLHIAMVQLFANLKVELFQYDQPSDANRAVPANCDTGASHICIKVLDLESALSHLKNLGCELMAGPIASVGGPCPDSNSWYVLDPFGHQLELVEYL
ncbi:VOC family protein [Halioxenophilus aromaticivorans]|uniref:VOC family protein n=1 Tax=Halioxenophilus aromaticivorans TaxID=1306992 RepID=A0AAV3TYJ0_9ALTE